MRSLSYSPSFEDHMVNDPDRTHVQYGESCVVVTISAMVKTVWLEATSCAHPLYAAWRPTVWLEAKYSKHIPNTRATVSPAIADHRLVTAELAFNVPEQTALTCTVWQLAKAD